MTKKMMRPGNERNWFFVTSLPFASRAPAIHQVLPKSALAKLIVIASANSMKKS